MALRRTRALAVAGLLLGAPGAPRAELPQPLSLEAALALADGAHPQLERAAALVDEALAERARVDSLDNLRVDLELAARYIEPSSRGRAADPSHNDSQAGIRVHARLYDFGRSGYLDQAADAQLRGRRADLLDARQQRRLEVMARFFDVLLADLEQARDTEAMAIAFVRVDRARSRHQLGQVADLALLELESRYQGLLSRQRASQAKQRATRSRLALALNHPEQLPADLAAPTLPVLERKPGESEPLVQRALEANPRLRALRASLTAARKRVAAATAGNGAELHGELLGTAYNRRLGGDDPLVAALVLTVPLSNGGAMEAEAARQRAEARRVQAELALKELEVRQAVLDEWLQLQTLQAQRAEIRALDAYRELNFDRSRTLYELEYTSDLGDAMAEISDVRLRKAENDYRIALAWARLDALTGRLLDAGADRPGDANAPEIEGENGS